RRALPPHRQGDEGAERRRRRGGLGGRRFSSHPSRSGVRQTMFKLDGKVAPVTGGSRGIGRACCEALAEHGATVVVNYVKGEAQAREVAEGIVKNGGKADIQGFDVADPK